MRPLAERFVGKVELIPFSTCWHWNGAIQSSGYGSIGEGGQYGRVLAAHRVAWELENGPIPDGLVVDHLCRQRDCVRPAHMELVTARENIARDYSYKIAKTHCKRGHSLEGAYLHKGRRHCRECGTMHRRATAASKPKVVRARKSQCKWGHPFSQDNTRIGISRGTIYQRCRACARERARSYRGEVN